MLSKSPFFPWSFGQEISNEELRSEEVKHVNIWKLLKPTKLSV